jgi:hypothetical protein
MADSKASAAMNLSVEDRWGRTNIDTGRYLTESMNSRAEPRSEQDD